MGYRNIVTKEDEILRKRSREVTDFGDRLISLLEDMTETMNRYNGVGIAAVQVGVLRRVVVIDVGEGIVELINPVIIEQSGKQDGKEGCLSCPNEFGMVVRPEYVKVKALNRHGKEFTIEGEEMMARAICHELDHLDGKIFLDIARDVTYEDGE